ncbi:hypothetical protein IPV08_10625 [Methylobacterium sp. SD274]|uniref:Uncharacterized protein n=1 Tax=Methylobacterium gossipiicola TaxID=582675 RepID=A0A1I2UZE2_9HYPH|nr:MULTISPECIES: hypothetical protein [Methylobacterium]MBO1020422.1 hypothetical protein [Methylobacterium sp. SD274]SFG81217.1 hypothetical protein SAMN05192565_11232 [Methylobacterium gossipiicola]
MGRVFDEAHFAMSAAEQYACCTDPHEEPEDVAYSHDLAILREGGLPVPSVTAPVISAQRLDLASIWRALPDEDRDRIGELALGVITGAFVSAAAGRTAESAARACAAHGRASLDALSDEMPDILYAALQGPSWRIPASLGPICTGCGCSEHDACHGECRWTDERRIRCTACDDPSAHIPF